MVPAKLPRNETITKVGVVESPWLMIMLVPDDIVPNPYFSVISPSLPLNTRLSNDVNKIVTVLNVFMSDEIVALRLIVQPGAAVFFKVQGVTCNNVCRVRPNTLHVTRYGHRATSFSYHRIIF